MPIKDWDMKISSLCLGVFVAEYCSFRGSVRRNRCFIAFLLLVSKEKTYNYRV